MIKEPKRNPEPAAATPDSLAEGLLSPGVVVQGFTILRVLRSGQANNVYVAHSADGVEVALKEYFPRRHARRMPSGFIEPAAGVPRHVFDAGIRGFVAEATALAQIRSELLAQVVAAFRDNGTVYLATKMEPGETIEQWARRTIKGGAFPGEDDLRFVFWSLLHAVQTMHEHGYLHLDIKPSNAILRDLNTPILIDLGGARKFATPGTSRGVVSASNFTPGFAAPEQHLEQIELFCAATDVYGIGASILYCMTGKVPPLASQRNADDPMAPLFERCRHRYSRQLVETVQGCLVVPIEGRYGDVRYLQNLIGS